MDTAVFYERRKEFSSIDFKDRRVTQRRQQEAPVSQEHRRLASQIRRHEREAFKIPVRLKIQEKEISGYTHDICSEGLLVFTDTTLSPGIPMALKFSFGEHVCHLNVSGQVVFCRSTENSGSNQHAIGIKFSGIRDFEKNILTSAVQELKQNTSTHEKSLLNILVSTDILAHEAADFTTRPPKTLEEKHTTLPSIQLPVFERRFSPRIGSNLAVRIYPGDISGNILNISETGFFFVSEKPVPAKDVLISVDLSPFKSDQLIETSAEIVMKRADTEDKFIYGARFSSALNEEDITNIQDFLFDGFAKRASSIVKNNEGLKIQIEDFFNKDVKQYHKDLSTLLKVSYNNGSKSDEIAGKVANLTNELLLKGNALDKTGENDRYMKRVKQVFRESAGYWVYKSPISKMAYDKPRGYPGDYRLFELIYDNVPLSDEDIGFYFDKYFLTNTYTAAVRSRKDKMKNILKDFIKENRSACVRLLNMACGGSKEIRELFTEPFVYGRRMVFTGLDHDEKALQLSSASLNYLPPNVEARFLKENVLNIFRDEKYYSIIGKQDIIYILGLTEYLPDRIFKKLIHFLFQLLNDGGKLVITYKDKNIPIPGLPPDWFCDWAFIKRSEEDLINAAKGLGEGNYSLKIEREGTGCILFLILTKI